ncbi:sodium/phosphate symporter [Natronomonas halophila]|uniref:sodium/phosphate symporter n=1 Tax=Natronomonas halophila TaxID=2747817 RepID=UPI0015B73B27|nr:sodium/phosphate symporter [Natronomonas halophila]QLD87084.1 sodium/phosphate symporter [Natronomonas halophila]
MRRRSYAFVVGAVFAIALAMRTVPLYWSPLPSTLDGFAYAGLARDTLQTGAYPLSQRPRADFFILTLLTAVTGSVTGETPVHVIQPMISVIGAAIVVVGVALTRRLGTELGWPSKRVRFAALITGLLLAVEGLFLRRSMEPDPEVLGMLLALLSVIALHRLLSTDDTRWVLPLAVLLFAYPLLHIFSTFNAAVGLVAVFALMVFAKPNRRVALIGSAIVGGFWLYFIAYFEVVQRLDILTVSYVGRVTSNPGLFTAWILALVFGAGWYQRTSNRTQRVVFLAPLGVLFVLVIVNVVQPIYPGTIRSPPEVALLISFLVVPVLFAGYATPAISKRYTHAVPVIAMFAAPLVIIYFSLTASLTPDFFATGMRAQTFMHVSAFVLVGLAAATIVRGRSLASPSWRVVRIGALVVLVSCTLVTTPLAFVSLDTFHYPATTTGSEFEATEFASERIPGNWASQDGPDRIASHYFEGGGSHAPTRTWLTGGSPPDCPVLLQESWITHGAYLWPAQPQTLPKPAYDSFIADRNLVYSSSGRDPLAIAAPRTARSGETC